jgi:hypothetical protein
VNSWRQGFPDFRRWAFNSFELRLPDDRSNCYSAFWERWPPVSVEVLEFSKELAPRCGPLDFISCHDLLAILF